MKSFKQFLKEDWYSSVNDSNNHNKTEDIFINPTKEELIKSLNSGMGSLKHFRWIALEKTKNIYVASANLLHNILAREVYRKEKSGIRIAGDGYLNIKTKKWEFNFFQEDTLYPSEDGYFMDNYYLGPDFYNYDWSFMDQWIPNFTHDINSCKDSVIAAYKEYKENEK